MADVKHGMDDMNEKMENFTKEMRRKQHRILTDLNTEISFINLRMTEINNKIEGVLGKRKCEDLPYTFNEQAFKTQKMRTMEDESNNDHHTFPNTLNTDTDTDDGESSVNLLATEEY